MSVTTQHIATIPSESWTETIVGATPHSFAISTNSKGAAQIEVKCYYASPVDMADNAATDLAAIIAQLKSTLQAQGIPLAGQEGK